MPAGMAGSPPLIDCSHVSGRDIPSGWARHRSRGIRKIQPGPHLPWTSARGCARPSFIAAVVGGKEVELEQEGRGESRDLRGIARCETKRASIWPAS